MIVRYALFTFRVLQVVLGLWGYKLVYPHGSTWAVPDEVAQLARKGRWISELLSEPCGASRDYLLVKET
jgi:hypothetical protein